MLFYMVVNLKGSVPVSSRGLRTMWFYAGMELQL